MYAGVPAISPVAARRRRRSAEVRQADAAVAVDHDVGGFQIAMQHVAVVHRGKSRAQLPRDLKALVFRQPADAAEQRVEVFAVDVLHRQKAAAVDLPDVVDTADVRM